jgi:DNA-binding HxlR family transcriptional regulator
MPTRAAASSLSSSGTASPQLAEAVTITLRLLGGKWKLLILWHLWSRTWRFNELMRAIPRIAQHMLTTPLRELEADGIVRRTIYAEVPPRVEYPGTEYAGTLEEVLRALAAWGSAHMQRSAQTSLRGRSLKPGDTASTPETAFLIKLNAHHDQAPRPHAARGLTGPTKRR